MYEGINSTQDKNFLIYHKEVGQIPLLSKEEELEIFDSIRSDDKTISEAASQRLIESNLRLVVKIASDYSNLGLEISDLIGEGNIGLMRAAQKFDPTKGAKFSTYACYWIKQSVKRALSNKSRTIRLPVHLTQLAYAINMFIKKYQSERERIPTDEEVAEALEVNVEKVRKTKTAINLNLLTRLDEKVDENEGKEVIDTVEDSINANPLESLAIFNDRETLKMEMDSSLDERERRVLEGRFGLNDNDCYTLEQLGDRYGITRERIRQIEYEALKKLRIKLSKKMADRA